MSLTISITTPEGIVLAADSRQTYKNMVNASRIGSDSATKIFQINENIGVTVAGPAFLVDENDKTKTPKGIGWFINEFLNQMGKKETVESVTTKLGKFLESIYRPDIQMEAICKQFEQQIKNQNGKIIKSEKIDNGRAVQYDIVDSDGKPGKGYVEVMPISLIVSGYDIKDSGPELSSYLVYVPGPIEYARKFGDQNQFGANWTGQTDVVTRMIKGFDPRISALNFVQAAKSNLGEQQISNELNSLQYNINWGTMTLNDAVDLAKLMIETTSAVQRYSDGIGLFPGDIPGVGGPVDIAVILPKDGFHWNQRKKINLEKPEK